jgi:molecular chaperone GrpE (heat shock protein)
VEDVATSTSEPRLRDLLKSLLILHDLIGQMHDQTSEDDAPHHSNYGNLLIQVRQMLEYNHLSLIDGTGDFDPTIHRPVKTVPCASPDESGQIHQLVRPGFRTESSVLRYAEVVLTRYEEGDDEASAGDDTPTPTAEADTIGEQTATNREGAQ